MGVGTTYSFRFVFLLNLLQVLVDDAIQISVNGACNNGSMAFYNLSQADVTDSVFTVRQVSTVPEPSTVVLLATGLLTAGLLAAGLLATVFLRRWKRVSKCRCRTTHDA